MIRKGQRKDIAAVLELIRELADCERALNEVELRADELENDCFGPDPVCGFIVSETSHEITGMALYYWKYSTWKGRCLYLEDIIVKQAYRRQGIGSRLFENVIAVAKRAGVKRLEWQVLNWNRAARSFYARYGASFDETWINGRLNFSQLQQFKCSE